MQLGARGVLDIMNSMGGLQSASKCWSPGDRVVYIFPVLAEKDETGMPVIPIAFQFGHNVDLGDDFKRSFIPTKAEINPVTHRPVEPDFAFQTAGIFRALLEGEKERKIEQAKQNAPNETALKVDLKGIEEDFKKRFPAVSNMQVRAYTEVLVGKLDVNGRLIGGETKFEYANIQLSKKKLNQLLTRLTEPGAYREGDKYFYVTMQTQTGDKKLAGQVDWNAITDETKKLEVLHPDFKEKVESTFLQKNPTADTIAAKVYDFRDYDVDAFKSAVSHYVADRKYQLVTADGEYREFVRKQHNVDVLKNIGLVADAEQLQKLLGTPEDAQPALTDADAPEENQPAAQSLDLSQLG